MELRPLGSTGILVSTICIGTGMFGSRGNGDPDASVETIQAAFDAGINFVETADSYGHGETEGIVGAALGKVNRDDIIVATKFGLSTGGGRNDRGNSRRWIIRACEASLRRLRTDYIDIYQLHTPDPSCDLTETLSALSDLIHAGKVRYIGTSKFAPSALVEAQWISEQRHLERFVTEQPPYSLLARGVELDVLPTCRRHAIGAVTWGPLAGGWLSGRWRLTDTPDMSGNVRSSRAPDRYDLERPENQRKLVAVDALATLADEMGTTLVKLAISWVLNHPAVSSTVVGPRNVAQLETLLGSDEVHLTHELLDRIDEIVPPGTNFSLSHADTGYVPPSLAASARRRVGIA